MNILEVIESELKNIKNAYPNFIEFTLSDIEDYKEINPHIAEQLLAFLTRHNNLSAGKVCEYMCYLIGLPYEENGIWYRWDTVITEEEAERIVREEYSE